MVSAVTLDRAAIAALCREFAVRRLVVFGSILTDRFDDSSDVDFLVDFGDEVDDRFEAFFGLKEALESLLGRPVDLVAPAAMDNPYFAASVEQNSEELYAA